MNSEMIFRMHMLEAMAEDKDAAGELLDAYFSLHLGPTGAKVFLLLLEEQAADGEGVTLFEMADSFPFAGTSATEQDIINNIRVAVCGLRKRLKRMGSDYEIVTERSSNLQAGRYALKLI